MKWQRVLGREGDIVVGDASVSCRHARLIRNGDDLYIEDLGSTNGTFVNGAPVALKKLRADDKITLGGFEIDLRKINPPMGDTAYRTAFYALKSVYDTYVGKKIKLQTSGAFKMMTRRSLPMAVPTLFGAVMLCLLKPGVYTVMAGATVAIGALVIGVHLGAKEAAKMPQRMSDLTDDFKKNYICPDCKRYFTDIPWENLRLQGQCPLCKRKFEEE
jgi:ribosomal protein L37AE/L43A